MVVGDIDLGTDILVIGAGPAGYTLAILCAKKGMDVTMVHDGMLGGICLQRGCIPIKTIEHSLDIAKMCKNAARFGVNVKDVSVDLNGVYAWKDKVVKKLESGLSQLCSASGVQVLEGRCSFLSSYKAKVEGKTGTQRIDFNRAVIATGSTYKPLPDVPFDGATIIAPDDALDFKSVPEDIVILGRGYIGATMGTYMVKLGPKVTMATSGDRLLTNIDEEIVKPVLDHFEKNGAKIYYNASWSVEKTTDGARIRLKTGDGERTVETKKLMVAIGSLGNVKGLGLENTKVELKKNDFIKVDDHFKTADPSIYAIGDVDGKIRNASNAFREAMSLAEMLSGNPGLPEPVSLPFTLSSDPEIAAVGMSENEARDAGIDVITGKFPFLANGKAVGMGETDGMVKVVAEKETHRILGVQIVGPKALAISDESLLALEMGAKLEDIYLTIHPHPTVSEALHDACAMALGKSINSPKQ